MEPDYGPIESRYYDPSYAVLRSPSGDAAFYLALARETGGPVLELGCGTGRVLLPIARAGIAAVGLDRSPDMLAVLREKDPPLTLRLVHASMTDFDLGSERFPLIFSAFRAFQHLSAIDEQLACLAAVRRHLAPGGLLAFDVFSPDLSRLGAPGEEFEEGTFVHEDGALTRFARVAPDVATQTLHVDFRWVMRRPDGGVSETLSHFTMRWFYRWELEHLLARAGFRIVDCFGDFDRRPYDRTAREIILLARAA